MPSRTRALICEVFDVQRVRYIVFTYAHVDLGCFRHAVRSTLPGIHSSPTTVLMQTSLRSWGVYALSDVGPLFVLSPFLLLITPFISPGV